MRGYYGYRKKSRLPIILLCLAVLVALGFAGRWGWNKYMAGNDVSEIPESNTVEETHSERIGLMVTSNDISEDQYWVRIGKRGYILELYKGVEMEKSYSIAVGAGYGNKERSGDNRTPEGTFTIEEIQNSTHWIHDFGDGKGPIEGAYGPLFIRLKTGWEGIGIHGTHDPSSIGTNITAGCIRMLNDDIKQLANRVHEGTIVIIEE